MYNTDARRAGRLVVAQGVVVLVIAGSAALLGWRIARDVLIGGSVATLGSVVFALWVFGAYRAREPSRLVMRFYGGELVKILMVATVFGLAVVWLEDINPMAVFGAFLIVQVLPSLLANRIAR